MTDAVRAAEQRRADTLARLEADADIWVATANAGRPHLVPLSLAWDGTHVILATPAASPTARNATASGEVRLALGTSRDVTIIEAAAKVVPCAHAPDPVAQCYGTRTRWNPRQEDVPHVYLIATPTQHARVEQPGGDQRPHHHVRWPMDTSLTWQRRIISGPDSQPGHRMLHPAPRLIRPIVGRRCGPGRDGSEPGS